MTRTEASFPSNPTIDASRNPRQASLAESHDLADAGEVVAGIPVLPFLHAKLMPSLYQTFAFMFTARTHLPFIEC